MINQSVLNRSRNDKFLFVMDIPLAMKKMTDLVLQEDYHPNTVQFTTFGSPVPKISIPSIAVPFGGQVYNASSISRPAYEPLSLKFLIDNGYKNYWILWQWLNLFNDNDTSTTKITEPQGYYKDTLYLKNPMSDFTSKFSLFGLDEYNNKIIEFIYTDCFIKELTPIDYTFQGGSEIVCTATFSFNKLKVNLLKDIDVSSC